MKNTKQSKINIFFIKNNIKKSFYFFGHQNDRKCVTYSISQIETRQYPRATRLLFMYFIEDLTNLLDLFNETQMILPNCPTINEPKMKKSLFTFINAYSNSEVKRIIKITYGDGCEALRLLQARYAGVTSDDAVCLERNFNTSQIQHTESATIYITRFRNANY